MLIQPITPAMRAANEAEEARRRRIALAMMRELGPRPAPRRQLSIGQTADLAKRMEARREARRH